MLSESDRTIVKDILDRLSGTKALAVELPFLNPAASIPAKDQKAALEDYLIASENLLDFVPLHGKGLAVAAQEILFIATSRWPTSAGAYHLLAQTCLWLDEPEQERKSLEMAQRLCEMVEPDYPKKESLGLALERLNKCETVKNVAQGRPMRPILLHLFKGFIWLGVAAGLAFSLR